MRSPVGFCFSQPSRSGKIVWSSRKLTGSTGFAPPAPGSAIGHRLESLGHLLETLGGLVRALLARLRRLLDGLRGLLRCFFGLLLLGALAACCRSQRQRHRHDCHSMHAHHPRPHSNSVAKRAFYSLPSVRRSTAAVFEFIEARRRRFGQARTCTPLRAPTPCGASAKRGFGVAGARAARELLGGCGVAEVNPTTTDG